MLARELGEALRLPVIHSDFYRPGWEEAHPALIAADEWVIDAMRFGTLDDRISRADTVVFVDRSTAGCLWGILRRRLRYRGGLHADGVADFVNLEFLRWVVSFRRGVRPRIFELLQRHGTTTEVVVVKSIAEAKAFVASTRVRPAPRAASAPRAATHR